MYAVNAQQQQSPPTETIRFFDELGQLTVFVYNLLPESTVISIKNLFALNGIEPIVGVYLGRRQSPQAAGGAIPASSSSTSSSDLNTSSSCPFYAICVFGSPALTRRALSLRYLVSQNNGRNEMPEVARRATKFPLTLHMCESLLNLHVPFKWSNSTRVQQVKEEGEYEEENTKKKPIIKVTVTILFNNMVQVAERTESVEVLDSESDRIVEIVKRASGTAFRNALGDVELVICPSDPSRNVLKEIDQSAT